ncbi:related to negative transcription regulator [Rhynchosporium secalis]|uniref:Mediator of RNA polymerase II transcription subunit 10 n=1 Tax=Rhynchosporium secalis TaxID=38038 RepID=A0A1E1MUL3_RHYSE|nr:related to negative transcription regulator [Rhynchosporium secalis]
MAPPARVRLVIVKKAGPELEAESGPSHISLTASSSSTTPQQVAADMAPVGQTDHDVLEKQVKEAIQDLYQIMVQTNAYDLTSRPSSAVLEATIKQFDSQLLRIHQTASKSSNLPLIPPELIQYVDNGRNPDIYTREFVELARKGNQLMKGKMDAFASFRDVLANEMGVAMPEIREDVLRVVRETGGREEVVGREDETRAEGEARV